MTVSAWRITKERYARTAFDGEGARRYGGRWNHPGTRLIYTAQSQALAVLEVLVHLDSPELLKKYVLLEVSIEQSLVHDLDVSLLPRNWRAEPTPAKVRAIGEDWVSSGTSVVLRVPGTLVPGESNFLLNPQHPDFDRLRTAAPVPFEFDRRFTRR